MKNPEKSLSQREPVVAATELQSWRMRQRIQGTQISLLEIKK